MRVGDHAAGGDLGAVLEERARRPPAALEDARDRRPGADLHPARLGLARHGLRDRPHPADRVPPGALPAVHLAEDVVQQHVGAARGVRAREVAHDAVEAEAGLERLGLEPALEPLARGQGEEVEHVALQRERQAREVAARLPRREELGHPAARVGRRLEQERAQHVGHGGEARVVRRQPLGVAPAEARHLAPGGVQAAAHAQAPAAGQRQEVGERALDDAQPVPGEPQVADHLRMQQAHRVARGGIAEARVELLGHGRAADDTPALEHAHPQPGGGEVGRAGQAVVARPDDERVVGRRGARHGLRRAGSGAPRPPANRPSASGRAPCAAP